MVRIFTALGLMSGTSGDGIDASIIQSNGIDKYKEVLNRYFAYNTEIYENLHKLRDKILKIQDLQKYSNEINNLEKELTLFHAKVVKQIFEIFDQRIDLIGFHGQTIYHNAKEKVSTQLGNGNLLSQLTKTNVIYDFRQNDIKNGGEGAPLSPIFHKLIVEQNKIELPVCILNIGGISNITFVNKNNQDIFFSRDLGPGNCLIDEWIRKKTKKSYDNDGEIAKKGKVEISILNHALDDFDNKNYENVLSFDIKDFNLNFIRGLSLEDGAATITAFSGNIIGSRLFNFLKNEKSCNVLICGGGRKNKTLIDVIRKSSHDKFNIYPIDDFGIDGDYVESQAFAYLAIRSFLDLPISFPNTTGCKNPSIGGILAKNF